MVVFQVRHELAGKVFTCCSFIIKHDYKVTIYLLPHILLYMLLGCTPEEQQEVRAKKRHFPKDPKNTFLNLKNLKTREFVDVSTSLRCQVTEEMLAVLTEGAGREEGGGHSQETASSLSQLSIQTVFSMLSHLTQWSRYILYSKHKNGGEFTKQKKKLILIYMY